MRNRPKAPEERPLTPRQRAILVYGDSQGLTGRGFLNQREELGAWMAHRAELLAAAGSAGRPSAYFRFEICFETPEWIADVETLLAEHGLSTAALQAERASITLQEAQPADLNQEFMTSEAIHGLNLPVPTLESLAREFGQALAYHTYRGRPALIRKYALIHAAIRTVLRETLVPLIPPKKETIQ